MTPELDKIRSEIEAQRDHAQRDIDSAMRVRDIADAKLGLLDKIAAMNSLAAASPAPEPPARERHDVQRAVMALFTINFPEWAEAGIIIELPDIPAASLHTFLTRAVKAGKLRVEDGVYSLPPTLSETVAEIRAVFPAEEEAGDA